MDQIDQSNYPVWGGCYLCTNTLYTDMPDCIGCSAKEKCLCITEEFCLKAGAENYGVGLKTDDDESDICLLKLFCCTMGLTSNIAEPLCRQDAQQCCFIGQAAFPPDPKIPALIGTCLLVCWSKAGKSGFNMKFSEFQ